MKPNINILEISVSNYHHKLNKNKVLRKSEKQNDINYNKNNISYQINNSNKIRISAPLKGMKSIKNINNTNVYNNLHSHLSPVSTSKIQISYLNHFNNNSIYYSNNKKENLISKFKDKKINTEIKNVKSRLIFSPDKIANNNHNIKNGIELQKNRNMILKHKKIEDSKNNESSFDYKKTNFISSYKFLQNFNSEIKINNQYIQTCKKQETTKKKLIKILSKKNLFNEEKKEKFITSVSPRQIYKVEIINTTRKIKTINIPEIINPDEFIKLKKIGEGSFGKIFKAKWIQNNKNYAMKEMHFQTEDNFIFLQKKLKLSMDFGQKVNCDGLIKIYGYSQLKKKKDFYFYEIMELAQCDWEQEINTRKKSNNHYTEKELFSITKQLIKTLSLLQKNHITHRDIKLQNILLVNDKYKICDFGESRNLNQKGIIVQPVRGSELYMSPILFSGLNKKLMHVTHNTYKSDVFSLGMCILFAATLDCNSLYEIREMSNMKKIRNVLMNYLSKNYSNDFIEILLCLLEVKEKKRPDFIQMEKVIDLYENVNKIRL
jgi:hypothetical protein